MKRKKSKKNSSRRKLVIYGICSVMIGLSMYFFFRAYHYISDIPEANNITQEEIFNVTKIDESDIKLVRALKNDAFDSWLYEANDDKAKELTETQAIILKIIEGKIDISEIDEVMANLKERTEIITESDKEDLYVLYYKHLLSEYYDKANHSFEEMTVDHPEDNYEEIFDLLDLLNKIYSQKGMLSVVNDQLFRKSVSLLDDINSSFNEVNQIKSLFVDYDVLDNPIPEPETRLGLELNDYVYQVNDYLQSKQMVETFETKYKELQANLSDNELLIDQSIKMPDLVGLTVQQAQRELNRTNLNVSVQGYTNKYYRDGDRVPESQREIETWDDDKQDRIIRQEPAYLDYDFILEGATIQLIVENNPIEKTRNTSESSSSSTSESTTSSSDSTEESSDTTTSSQDDLD